MVSEINIQLDVEYSRFEIYRKKKILYTRTKEFFL